MRACIFVDGENFRHTICDLFPQFQQFEYLPKLANWTELFDWIVKEIIDDGERIRTYWYVIESVEFFPYNFPNPSKALTPETKQVAQTGLQNLLSKHIPYKDELDAITDEAKRVRRMSEIVTELNERKGNFLKRFNGWHVLQNGIAGQHKAVEFRRAGTIRCNLFDNCKLSREKAVDVKLASDMIKLKDIYDMAIIMSGDQDYVPAVGVVKDYGKRVVNVAFLTRRGDLLPGGARELNQAADWSIAIPYQTLGDYLKIRQLPLSVPEQELDKAD